MRKSRFLPILLLLAACEGGVGSVDSKQLLNSLAGPDVPTVQDALLTTARQAQQQGRYEQAIQLYQQILEKKPGDKDAMQGIADALRRSGSYDRALAAYDQMIAQDAANLAAREGKGLTLMAKGDFDTPVQIFDDIVKEDRTRWKTLNGLGILFTTRNLHTEAQRYFQEALKHRPDSPAILNNMGLSQALDREYDKSIASLTQAAQFAAPDSLERKRIELNAALVHAIGGNLDQARAIAERYYSGAALNNNLGLYAHLAKDDEMARSYLNMALTESKVFYEKAWDNLQDLSAAGGESSKPKAKTAGEKVKITSSPPEPAEPSPPALPDLPAAPSPTPAL